MTDVREGGEPTISRRCSASDQPVEQDSRIGSKRLCDCDELDHIYPSLAGGPYAIHGTNTPVSIGGFAFYGCNRMCNADILDLFSRVHLGTVEVVLSPRPTGNGDVSRCHPDVSAM